MGSETIIRTKANRPDIERLSVSALRGLIRLYQWLLSPYMGRACRFVPTCSCYAHEALAAKGLRALPQIASRIVRCNPFFGREIVYDPAPSPQPETRS